MSTTTNPALRQLQDYAKKVLGELHPEYDDNYPEAVKMFAHFEKKVSVLPTKEQLPEASRLVTLFKLASENKGLASIIASQSLLNDDTPYPVAAHIVPAALRAQTLFVAPSKHGQTHIVKAARKIEQTSVPGLPSNAIASVFLYRAIGLKN